MKRSTTFKAALLAVLCFAPVALAEPRSTTGNVSIVGRVPETVSLNFLDDQLVGAGVLSTQSGSGTRLSYVLDLGDVAPVGEAENSFRGAKVTLILRANTAYLLSATVNTTGLISDPEYIQLTDIGFGIMEAEIRPSGKWATRTNLQLAPRIDQDPLNAPIIDGVPGYTATLSDLAAGMPLLGGGPISFRGGLNSPSNGLLVSTRYAIYPQLFRSQAAFSATITYTLLTP